MHATYETQRTARDLRWPRDAVLPARVVVVSDALAERNGVGTYYADLVQQLQSRVEHISLIAPSAQGRADHEWFATPMPGDATQRLPYPKTRVLDRLIAEQDPHVIIIPTLGWYAYYALKIAKRRNIRVCVALHTNLEALAGLYWKGLSAAVCRWVLRSTSNWLMRGADAVVTMDVESLKHARQRGAKRVRQMGTPVGAQFMLQPRLPRSFNPPRVIFLGRLAAEKGVEQILEAARRLPEFRFCIGGDGPLRKRVEAAAAQSANLRYLGWIDRGAVQQAIDESDILVLPSRLETFGTVALEALARHRLVLVSRDCGIANWPALADGLFTIDNNEDLTAALARVAALPTWRQEAIAARGWEAVEQFNDETLQGWLTVLADVSGAAIPSAAETVAAR